MNSVSSGTEVLDEIYTIALLSLYMALEDSISLVAENAAATIGFLSLITGTLYYRLSNLEDPREREQYLVRKFEDRKWADAPLVIEFDDLYVEESTGLRYKLRRLFLGELDGDVVLSLYSGFGFDEEMWYDAMFMHPYHEATKSNVEYIESERLNPEKVKVLLRLDSLKRSDITHDISALLSFLKHADENFDGVEIGAKEIED